MNLNNITTEARNSNTLEIDTLSSLNLVKKINEEDQRVPIAIAKVLPDIARVVDEIIGAFQKGGRLIYIGAGTSGRLGILDASECPPTYGTNPDMVLGIIAGGQKAIRDAVEGAEDDFEQGQVDLKKIHLTEKDVVVGIAASGRTPYTIGALQYALSVGAVTVSVVSSQDSEMSKISKHTIAVIVGAEVIMGSTRMKAGTSQKLVLNMLSTASMIKIGKVYSNLMVDVQATNKKLIQRAKNIVILATGASDIEASGALTEQNGQTKAAILQLLTGRKGSDAIALLEKHAGKLRDALKEINKGFFDEAISLVNPIQGEIISITEVPVEVFSQKMMGDGFAIIPDEGKVYAPVDGEIVNMFPTRHAIGIKSTGGMEVLIHFGIDTVKLKGEGFKGFVNQGDKVKRGQLILEVDLDHVKQHVPSIVTSIIFTNLPNGVSIEVNRKGNTDAKQKNIILLKQKK